MRKRAAVEIEQMDLIQLEDGSARLVLKAIMTVSRALQIMQMVSPTETGYFIREEEPAKTKESITSQQRMYTKRDLAERLQVSIRTLDRAMIDGKLAFVKAGKRTYRFTEEQVQAYLARDVPQPEPVISDREAQRARVLEGARRGREIARKLKLQELERARRQKNKEA